MLNACPFFEKKITFCVSQQKKYMKAHIKCNVKHNFNKMPKLKFDFPIAKFIVIFF